MTFEDVTELNLNGETFNQKIIKRVTFVQHALLLFCYQGAEGKRTDVATEFHGAYIPE
jgi:hypothetical protein